MRLFAVDPYDLVLTKIERNADHDREAVMHLARTVPLDLKRLKRLYDEELKIYYEGGRHDSTVGLWIDMIQQERRRN